MFIRNKIYSVVIFLVLILGIIVAVRIFSGDEDTWICSNNVWVRHGNPSADMPANACGDQSNNAANSVGTRTIKLYYYNQKLDQQENKKMGASCDRAYILPVERIIATTNTPIQDAIKLLIMGELTYGEKSAGFTTEFPNNKFRLFGADLKDGVLTLDFPEVPGFTEGGSCRVGLLQAQIEKTAKQFPEVKEVKYTKILFQP
jgi:spore germination protein GerM